MDHIHHMVTYILKILEVFPDPDLTPETFTTVPQPLLTLLPRPLKISYAKSRT